MSYFKHLLILAALLCSTGCENLFPSAGGVATNTAPLPEPKATVRPGDIFDMHIGGVPSEIAQEYNLSYTVNQNGGVNIPKLGEVHVAGLSLAEVERMIQSRLTSSQIFTHPSVTINPAANSRAVIIGGGVRNPQRLVWSPDLTAGSAVILCGGLTDFGTLRGLKIIRDGQVTVYDGRKFENNPAQDPKLLPSDQVIVRQ